jgi:amidohydrolase
MHRLLTLAATSLVLVSVTPTAQVSLTPAALRSRIDAIASEIYPAIVAIRRDIHRYPELGFREKRTAGLVADKLRALKFDEVRTGVGVTGVVGVLKGGRPGPVVAIRADMDALPVPELIDVPYKSTVPNVKHACGHDGHTAIALGVAEIFSRLRAELPGTVVFLFQPAEEGDPDGGPSGAVRVLQDWPLQNPTPAVMFGLHSQPELRVGQIGYVSGATMASSDRFTIKIIGKQTHGALPHTGIDPVPIAAEIISAFQTIPSRQIDARTPTVVSVGMINGGSRFNIIADSVTLVGTVRSLVKGGGPTVSKMMDAILKGVTSSRGASYSFDYVETTPVTYNDPALVAASVPALRSVVGDGLAVTLPVMGAEDFAYYGQRIPAFYFFLGVGNPEKHITAMWHTEYFDIDEEALGVGMRAMAAVVADYLHQSQKTTSGVVF